MSWLPIRYRDFHDVPRAFIVEYGGARYLFDCPFDERLDEYPSHYAIHRLDPAAPVDADTWAGLASHGHFLDRIDVANVRFDRTRRAAVDASILDTLTSAEAGG